jgi:YspA, cpYpsA-related SLOG family
VTVRVIVCGSRGWHDRERIADRLNALVLERGYCFPDPLIVHGAARGADRIAGEEAGKAGLLVEAHPADWERHGKRAGLIRNEEMAARGADICLAFWDGRSTGTRHMMDTAARHGIDVRIVFPEEFGR